MKNPTVSAFFASASCVAFSGSRSSLPPSVVSSFVFSSVAPASCVLVGCASGFDSAVRLRFSRSVVFRVSEFGSGRSAFALRSIAMVREVASVSGGVLFSAPARPCPVGLAPAVSASACFSGLGSGSWAGLALALGLGVSVCVWLPVGVFPPASWGFVALGGGFFCCSPVQSSLF